MTEKKRKLGEYKPVPFPIPVDEATLTLKTKSKQKIKVFAQKDTNGKLTYERYDFAPNPNLKKVLKFNNLVIYQFRDTGDFALFLHHQEKKPIWCKLENHDIETLEAFCIAYRRQFHNPIPKTIRIRKKVERKMRTLIDRFKE